MIDHIKTLEGFLPTDFSPYSRVWIFQSSRPFSEKEELEINEQLLQFYLQWQAHGAAVKGWAKLLFKHFVVVLADETEVSVSGCSTDGMVRIIKSLERQYKVNFFDRTTLTFLVKGKAEMLPMNQVSYAIEKGFINAHTPLFNNTVTTKKELLENWLQPLHASWLGKKLNVSL